MIVHIRDHRRRSGRLRRAIFISAYALFAGLLGVLMGAGFITRAVNTSDWFLLIPAAAGNAVIITLAAAGIRDFLTEPGRPSTGASAA